MIKDFFVLDLRIQPYTLREAVDTLIRRLQNKERAFVVTVNAEIAVACGNDAYFKQVVNSADLILPDGIGIVWAGRYLGHTVPERVTGFDLTQELLEIAAANHYRVFLLGAAPGVAETAIKNCQSARPELVFAGFHDGFFSDSMVDDIIEEINQAQTDILLVALGMGKQEKWLYAHKNRVKAMILVGVGGTFDILAGNLARAPRFMQQHGLEWLFRLYKEPRRFWRMLAIPQFIFSVVLSKFISLR